MKKATDYLNKRIQYTGDVCNQPQNGTITKYTPSKWGDNVEITFDSGEKDVINADNINSKSPGCRFFFL